MNTEQALKRLGKIQGRLYKLIAQVETAKLVLVTQSYIAELEQWQAVCKDVPDKKVSTGTDFQEDHIR
jgi:hypothetical protein